MKTGDIPEFSGDTKLDDEMKGTAFLAFVTNLRLFLSKKGIPFNQVLVVNPTSKFDGVRMFKSSTKKGKVYIWYSKIVQLKELSTKEENILVLAELEKKKDTPFSDDLLIPLYSQLFEHVNKRPDRTFLAETFGRAKRKQEAIPELCGRILELWGGQRWRK